MSTLTTEQVERLLSLREMVDECLASHLAAAREQGDGEVVDLAEHVLLSGGKRLRPLLVPPLVVFISLPMMQFWQLSAKKT